MLKLETEVTTELQFEDIPLRSWRLS